MVITIWSANIAFWGLREITDKSV